MKPIKFNRAKTGRPTKFVRVNRYTLIETDINVPDSETIRKFKENRERIKENLKNPDKRNIDFFR